jgi:uncharacterized protein
MKFWDTSAVIPLLITERSTRQLQMLLSQDPAMTVWWGSRIECVSALSRLERDGMLDPQATILAHTHLSQFSAVWDEIDPSDEIRQLAVRYLRVHPLRAADALQLAAAFLASERRPRSLEVVTLDERLAVAAGKEGFPVLPDKAPE